MKSSVSDGVVGIVSWDYGEHARGGLGRAMMEMAKVLREYGVSVEVLTRSCWLPVRSGLWPGGLVARSSFFVFLFFCIQRWIDTHQIRTVILPTGPGGLFLWRKPKRCRLIIVSYHTYWQQSHMVPGQWWKRIFVPLERRTLRLADRILCYSPDTERVLLEQYGIPRIKLTLLPQLLDVAVWSQSLKAKSYHPTSLADSELRGAGLIPKESGLCVFIGRLDQRKGIDVLLRAWPDIVCATPTAHLVIVGDGRAWMRVRSVAAHHVSVQWISSLSQEELIRLVQRAELALCPSYLEGFGLACAEAMVAGTVVVASDCDGLRSLIRHRETGWLVPPGDPQALVAGVTYLLGDSSVRGCLSIAARDFVYHACDRGGARRQFLEVVYSACL